MCYFSAKLGYFLIWQVGNFCIWRVAEFSVILQFFGEKNG